MHGARFRRAAACAAVLTLAACHGSGAPTLASSVARRIDVKSACAALAALGTSAAALDGADLADPDAAQAALARAVTDYTTALVAFERFGPANLRTDAEAVRKAVVARHFARATVERAALDTWGRRNCSG